MPRGRVLPRSAILRLALSSGWLNRTDGGVPTQLAHNQATFKRRGSPTRTRRGAITETAKDLRREIFPPLKYLVPDLVVEGLLLLAGKPKVGKSWWALDVALASARGGYCLGNRKCEQGAVLYLALEDGKRRLQRRIDKLLPAFGEEWPGGSITQLHGRVLIRGVWRKLTGGVNSIPMRGSWSLMCSSSSEHRLARMRTLTSRTTLPWQDCRSWQPVGRSRFWCCIIPARVRARILSRRSAARWGCQVLRTLSS